MTDIDTSPEAVERWALAQEVLGNKHIAALLRQLAKEKAGAYWKGYEAGKTEGQKLARLNGHCDAAIQEARNAALEEAEKVAEDWAEWAKHGTCPAAIRALITPKQDEPTTT